jgi:phosphatidylglycerophosphatase A
MPAMEFDDEAPQPTESLGGRVAVWIATGLGVGLVAPAPGTIGGLWGLALVPVSSLAPIGAELSVILLLIVLAIWLCGAAARELGAGGDPGSIVLDEVVALPIVFVGFPPFGWAMLAAGFVLFRFFDIAKLGLARSAERLPGGVGVVADDVVSAMLACVALHVLAWLDRATGLDWLAAGV